MTDFAKLRELATTAETCAPSPWKHVRVRFMQHEVHGPGESTEGEQIALCESDATAEWIAAASPSTVIELLDAVENDTCARHADQKHGAEAEELRRGIEGLITKAERVANGKRAVGVRELQNLLDRVDARDSLAYLEAQDEKLAAMTKERDDLKDALTVTQTSCDRRGQALAQAHLDLNAANTAKNSAESAHSTALASLAAVTAERDEARAIGHDAIDKANRYMSEADAARAESERLLTELAVWKEEHVEVCAQRAEWLADRDAAVAESERLRTALTKISAIRDSIVGMQGFNFSEHAYPLVAALGEAGFDGAGYEIARKNLGTLIEQRDAAEAESERLRGEVERLALTADEREALGVLRFLLGKHSHEPYAYEGEDVETALAALDKLIGGGK